MKFLLIGGTNLISSAGSDLTVARGHELFIVNTSTSAYYADEARLTHFLLVID